MKSAANVPDIPTLHLLLEDYREGRQTPLQFFTWLCQRLAKEAMPGVWISRVDESALLARAREQTALLADNPTQALARYPLLGVPFAVKDNLDVAGLPTTAACPAFAYTPTVSAEAITRLEAAGAILVGKTNLDQFATGLVGTRSPYGVVPNPFNPDYVSGGSSSGSAAAVALGLVAFALGTDTAGSGRVPAGFCNLVGLKPTPGLVSNRGMVPACRSLDCVSVLAHTVADAWAVLSQLAGVDAADTYSRPVLPLGPLQRGLRIGLAQPLEFMGDALAEQAFSAALEALHADARLEFHPVPLAPFRAVAELLYDGPWVAERRAALGAFFDDHAARMDATVRQVIAKAEGKTAVEAFEGAYRLEAGKRMAEAVFQQVDCLLVPTAPTHYTLAQIAAEPLALNSALGLYTNFVNLLGLAAVALPGPFRSDGLPAGITLIGPAGSDHRLAELARSLEPLLHRRLGRGAALPPRQPEPLAPLAEVGPCLRLAVVGAHLSRLPLNGQLRERGARLLAATHTTPDYRLYALPGSVPPKPGLLRVAKDGVAIAVEVWEMPLRHFGNFVAEIPPPLGIGTLTLANGDTVKGFLCEPAALAEAEDISGYGGWRAYLARAQTA